MGYICIYNTQAWEHNSPTNNQEKKKLQSCSTKRGGSDKREIVGEGSARALHPSFIGKLCKWSSVLKLVIDLFSPWSPRLFPTTPARSLAAFFSVTAQRCIFQLSPCMFSLVGRLLILFFHRAKEVMWCEVWYREEWCLRKTWSQTSESTTPRNLWKLIVFSPLFPTTIHTFSVLQW